MACGSTIYSVILSEIPSNAVGTCLENALEQTRLLDCSWPHNISLSAWWQEVTKSNIAQTKKANALEEKVVSKDLLSAEDKSEVMALIVC